MSSTRKLAAALDGLDARVRLHLQLVDGEAVEHWRIEGGTGSPPCNGVCLSGDAPYDLARNRPGPA
jgi:hypothetical protein